MGSMLSESWIADSESIVENGNKKRPLSTETQSSCKRCKKLEEDYEKKLAEKEEEVKDYKEILSGAEASYLQVKEQQELAIQKILVLSEKCTQLLRVEEELQEKDEEIAEKIQE